jgi:arginine utilization protein RocB
MMTKEGRWYDEVRALTARLVRIDSVSPSVAGENACGAEIRQALAERGVASATWPMRADDRRIVWAMVEGGAVPPDAERIPTVVLLGHLDTAGIQDYGSDLDPFDPQGLRQHLLERWRRHPDAEDERLQDAASGEWMFGRGSFDMKSGVAAQIAVMGALERARASLPGNVLMVTTPDEEVESAGLMDALAPLIELRDARRLDLIGVINSDYTAPRQPGDEKRYIYRGTIGKLLCCFYVRGCETHVGEAFRGLDANLIAANLVRATNLNPDLCDEADGEITVPPVTQKVRDFKARYDAQTPISAVVHCSCLVHGWTPRDVLARMVALAGRALSEANHRRIEAWGDYARRQGSTDALLGLGGRVFTYGQLYRAVAERMGGADLREELDERAFGAIAGVRETLEPLPRAEREALIDRAHLVHMDSRERSLVIVRELVDVAVREGVLDARTPAIVVYFAPPFFPPIRGDPDSRLNRAIAADVAEGDYGELQFRGFYPYVSEISFMRVDQAVYDSLPLLKDNFPLWRDRSEELPEELRVETFSVPFDLIRELDCDVANIGPWGKEAHGRGERVHMPYSFEKVPELIHGVVLRLLSEPSGGGHV